MRAAAALGSNLGERIGLAACTRPRAVQVVRERAAADRAQAVLFTDVFNGDDGGHNSKEWDTDSH